LEGARGGQVAGGATLREERWTDPPVLLPPLLSPTSGALLASLTDAHLTTISPVNKPHPRRDVIISGSSRCLYAWVPNEEGGEEEEGGAVAGGSGGGGDAEMELMRRAAAAYAFFDADPGGDSAKKKKGGGGGRGKGRGPPGDDSD